MNRCGVPAGSRYRSAIDPGVCPRRWITDSVIWPTVSVSPCSTRKSGGTGNGARPAGGPPCWRRSPRDRAQCLPVVLVLVGGDDRAQGRAVRAVADQVRDLLQRVRAEVL